MIQRLLNDMVWLTKLFPEKLLADAEELAKRLAAKPTVAMKMMKKTVNLGMQMDLSSATNLEIESFVIAFATDDRRRNKSFIRETQTKFYRKITPAAFYSVLLHRPRSDEKALNSFRNEGFLNE